MAATQQCLSLSWKGALTNTKGFTTSKTPDCRVCASSSSPSSLRIRRDRNRSVLVRAAEKAAPDFEFGARDPFPEELESNFGDKVLGYSNTEHVILVPTAQALSLAQRSCVLPLPAGTTPFTVEEAKALLRKIVGWRLLEDQSGLKLECEWRLKNHEAGLELQNRLSKVTDAEGKPLELNFDDQTHILKAEIWTESIGGLCENDFILAAKIDQVKTSDLIKRNRYWA